MIAGGDTVTVALSGGADSVALAMALLEIRKKLQFDLRAVHINHNLRGDEANRDEQFVRDFCKTYEISLDVFSIDVGEIAQTRKESVELVAREERYRIFKSTTGKVATAHTLDDCAETLIFNITRGSGLRGLCSIPPVRDNIIRPLIECERAQIEHYLKSKNQQFVTDSTNLTDDYTRNKIRHNVIPTLKEINSAFLLSVGRLTDTAVSLDRFVKSQAKRLIDADLPMLRSADDIILAEWVRLRCEGFGATPDYNHTKSAIDVIKNGGKTQICDNLFLQTTREKVVFTSKPAPPFCVPFSLGKVKTPHSTILIEKIELNKINNLLFNSCVDYDKIIEHNIVIRSRKEADKIRIPKRNCTKLLRKVYNEKHILPSNRSRLAIIARDDGEIIWAEEVGVDQKYSVSENTKQAIRITVLKD